MTIDARAALLPLFAALALAGCSSTPVGDLGRKRESVFHDTIMAGAGSFAAREREEKVSSFRNTDDELELRHVAWDLVRPPHRDDIKGNALAELRWARVVPDHYYEGYPKAYHASLIALNTASHETRYERLTLQARSDAQRLPAFRDVATRVGKADGARRAALDMLAADSALRKEAEARIYENGRIVGWVKAAMGKRVESYRYALGRLMVETPSPKSVEAEAAIDALQWEISGSTRTMASSGEGGGRAGNGRRFFPKGEKPDEPVPIK